MGAGNVKAVYGLWGDLPDAAFRLLIYMATIAMDEDDPPRFYGGRETMAYALGWVVEDRKTVDPAEISKRERAFKSVHRLVCVLKRAGAITTLVAAAPGRTAEYALNLKVNRSLKNWDRSRPRSQKKGDHSEPAEAAPEAPQGGNGPKSFDVTVPKESAERSQFSRRTVPSERGPQEEKEQERTTGEEEMAEVSPTSHPLRASQPSQPGSVVELFKGVTGEAPYRSPPVISRWRNRDDPITEAMERQAARRAEHQARLASGETT